MNLRTAPLFVAWHESLAIFFPSNLKIFLLLTFKATYEAYKIFFTHFWWLIGATTITHIGYATQTFEVPGYFVITLFLWILHLFLIYLSLRPSIERKGYEYFFGYSGYFICFFIIVCGLIIMKAEIVFPRIDYMSYIVNMMLMTITSWGILLDHTSPLFPLYLSPFFSFWAFFFLDSRLTLGNMVRSITKAGKMVIYNYPFCILICSLSVLLHVGIGTVLWLVIKNIINIVNSEKALLYRDSVWPLFLYVMLLLAPFFISLLSNFYIKRLHEQFLLYYPQKTLQ